MLNAPLDNLYFGGDIEILRQFAAEFPAEFVLADKTKSQQLIAEIAASNSDISQTLFNNYSKSLQKAVENVFGKTEYGDKNFEIQRQFAANAGRFAAYKAYHVTGAVRRQRVNQSGAIRSDSEFYEYAQKVLNAANRYQAAEYQAAIARSRTARQWREFQDDPDVPNLKWIPSLAARQREDHKKFYGLVLPKNHPFWQTNQPGNLWGCRCDWIETFDDAADKAPAGPPPARGLEGNPAQTGEIFTDRASYFKATEKITLAGNDSLTALFNHKPKDWRMDYYSDGGGFLATGRERIKQGELNKQERKKFEKEHDMCISLAAAGNTVEYLPEKPGSFDINLNGIAADLKKTASANNIVKYAKKAVTLQGAKIVVFEFEKETKEIYAEIQSLIRINIHGYYYFSDNKNKLFEF